MKKINYINWLVILLVSTTFMSCDDVLEDDITDGNITISYPEEGTISTTNITPFNWNNLEGAEEYRIQISNPSNVILVDSLVPSNSFNYELTPGTYKWRVRGENFAYQTAYSFPASFMVEVSDVLTLQTVVLNTPTDNFYFNDPTTIINTTWNAITTADSYTFELQKNTSGSVSSVYTETGITIAYYTIDATQISNDAVYLWNVKALNASTTTETLFSTRSLWLDTQLPSAPIPSLPLDNATMSGPVTFEWDNIADTGIVMSPVQTTLEISNDSNFTSILATIDVGTDIVGTDTEIFTFPTNSTPTEYYWRLINRDLATNIILSSEQKITIN